MTGCAGSLSPLGFSHAVKRRALLPAKSTFLVDCHLQEGGGGQGSLVTRVGVWKAAEEPGEAWRSQGASGPGVSPEFPPILHREVVKYCQTVGPSFAQTAHPLGPPGFPPALFVDS